MRRYSNTPYIPRGTSCSLYLDVGSLKGGTSSTQFPLNRLHLHQLIPFTRAELLLLHEEGEERLEMYPHLPEILWESLVEEHCLSNPISLSVPMLAPPPYLEEGTQTKGGSDCHPTNTQTEGGSGYHLSFKLLQDANQARAQLRIWAHPGDTKSWLKGTNISEPNRPGGTCKGGGYIWSTKLMPPSRRYFPRQVSKEAVKLLPWCNSVPWCLSTT